MNNVTSTPLLGGMLAMALLLPAAPAAAATDTATPGSPAVRQAPDASAKNASAERKKTGGTRVSSRPAARAKSARSTAARRPLVLTTGEPAIPEEALCYRRTAGRGRCEPQCLPYTRCRAGISSCRTGHENGPVTWFRCEQARGNTSAEPADGRVLVLGRNAHNMPTGHTLYVEKAEPRGDGRYLLTLSHTNYDRRCNLETNMLADYDPASKTIDVLAGKWERWGRDLKVAGFIHD